MVSNRSKSDNLPVSYNTDGDDELVNEAIEMIINHSHEQPNNDMDIVSSINDTDIGDVRHYNKLRTVDMNNNEADTAGGNGNDNNHPTVEGMIDKFVVEDNNQKEQTKKAPIQAERNVENGDTTK